MFIVKMHGICAVLLVCLKAISAVISGKYEIDVWKFENGKLNTVREEMYEIQLPWTECLLILQREFEVNPENWKVYYWVPENATPKDVYGVAVSAISADYKLHSRVKVHREMAGYESSSLMKLRFPAKGTSDHVEPPNWRYAKKMFLIEAKNSDILTTQMTEVPVHVKHVFGKRDHCLVCALDEIYVYCEEGATAKQKDGAGELAKILLKRRQQNSEVVEIAALRETKLKGKLGFLEFVEKIQTASRTISLQGRVLSNERPFIFMLEEMRRILAQTSVQPDGTEIFDIKIIQIDKNVLGDHDSVTEEDLRCSYKYLADFDSEKCYVIDSRSNLGLLVWMGQYAGIELRKEVTVWAEKLLRNYDYGIPLTFIDEEDITPELFNVQNFKQERVTINQVVATVLSKFVNQ